MPASGSAIRAATSTDGGGSFFVSGCFARLASSLSSVLSSFVGFLATTFATAGGSAFTGFASGGAAGSATVGFVGGVCGGVARAAVGGVCGGVLTPPDCGPGGNARLSAVSFAVVAGESAATVTGAVSARCVHCQPSRQPISTTSVTAAPPRSQELPPRIVLNHGLPARSRSSVVESAATRSSGGGPAAAGSGAAAAAGAQPGGGTICTMLRHFGHSRICPTAASERTASRARHVVHVMENILFPTVPPAAR